MWRHIASNAVTMLIVLLFLAGGTILWGKSRYDGAGPLTESFCVEVPTGSNMRQISVDLQTAGAITSGSIFRMGADYQEKAGQLKAGSYLVPSGASMAQIVDAITRGGANTCGTEVIYRIGVNRVTIQLRAFDTANDGLVEIATFDPSQDDVPPEYVDGKDAPGTQFRLVLAEGVTSWQVAESLAQIDILEGNLEDVPPEGALAPRSYDLRIGDSRAELAEEMTRIQEERVAAVWTSRADSLPIETPEELLILASIIEKETAVAEERGQVASVFVNRLNQGMRLQTDPTVIYGLTEGRGVLGRGIRQSELRAATPWNTYVILGLPPTPIANPGLASLEAAAQPLETPYLFFVADGTGGHAFAETLAEHNQNVAVWRRIEAERANQSTDN
ncbi:MAG: endolytic transglycosylase MltG [Pseudomonadota bacterium]